MIRTSAVAILALLALSAQSSAQTMTAALDAPRPILRAEATVSGDYVRIGDLIENAGIVADIAVFRAPDLGTTGVVSAAQVVEAVRSHAIVELNTDGIAEVAVTRPSRGIPVEEIQNDITSALAAQFALGSPKYIALNFDRGLRTVQVEPKAKGATNVTRLTYDQRSGRFDATLDFAGAARQRFTGVATVTAEVLTLTRSLSRGETIKAADLVSERRPRADISADMVTGIEQAAGLAARNALSSGRPLRTTDLMKPDMIRRNENVTLVYEAPGLTLTLRGKAMDSGSEGEAIEVLNVQSKRLVQGVITGPGRVLVSTATPSVVAEADPKSSAATKAPTRAQ